MSGDAKTEVEAGSSAEASGNGVNAPSSSIPRLPHIPFLILVKSPHPRPRSSKRIHDAVIRLGKLL